MVLAVLVGLSIVFVKKEGDGFVVVTRSDSYDPRGALDDFFNDLTRDCSAVENLDLRSAEVSRIARNFRAAGATTESPLKITRIEHASKLGDWYIVSADFDNAEGGVLLLEKRKNLYAEVAGFGGATVPYRYAPQLRAHFRKLAPSAPKALIQCYERVI